jgi:hypothetical protein
MYCCENVREIGPTRSGPKAAVGKAPGAGHVKPAGAGGAVGEGVGDEDGVGDADGVGDGDDDGNGVGDGEAAGVGDGDTTGVGVGEAVGVGADDGTGNGDAAGDGCTAGAVVQNTSTSPGYSMSESVAGSTQPSPAKVIGTSAQPANNIGTASATAAVTKRRRLRGMVRIPPKPEYLREIGLSRPFRRATQVASSCVNGQEESVLALSHPRSGS